MAAFVRETKAGWEVVEGDRVLSTHASHIEALDAALARNGGRSKDALLRDPDTKDLNGAWRWLHATDVEDAPAYDGARIDETTVAQAVASLNSQPLPRPINGGAPDSPAHAPSGDSIATGYAHHAVTVVDSDGRHGAYVIAELVPSVARVVDSGRVAWTSIGLGGSVGDDATIRDAEFDHLALTCTPAIKTLTPSAAIRAPGERFVAVRTHRLNRAAGPQRKTAMAENAAPESAPVARAEMADDMHAALMALLEAHGIAPDAPDAAAAVMALVEKLKSEKPEDDAEVEMAEADKAKASAAEAARSEKVAHLEEQVALLRADKEAREDAEFLDGLLAPRKLAVKTETRARFLSVLRTDRKTGRDVVRDLVAEMHVPPVTRSVPATGSVDTEETADSDALVKRAAALLPDIRKQFPGEPEHLLVARAQRAARAA